VVLIINDKADSREHVCIGIEIRDHPTYLEEL
jgi:hypothetical protein